MEALQRSAAAAVLFGFLLLTSATVIPLPAVARTGGCVGSTSSRSSSSSSSKYYKSCSKISVSPKYYESCSSTTTNTSDTAEPEKSKFNLSTVDFLLIFFVAVVFVSLLWYSTVHTTVVMLQVCLMGTAKSLQSDIDKIALNANTSTEDGLASLLKEITLALLRRPEFFVSAHQIWRHSSSEGADCFFNELSVQERSKFEEETLRNLDGKIHHKAQNPNIKCSKNEYILVTILVVAARTLYLEPINDSSKLKRALQQLAAMAPHNIKAVQVLWEPQQKDDLLSEEELLKKYPNLKPV